MYVDLVTKYGLQARKTPDVKGVDTLFHLGQFEMIWLGHQIWTKIWLNSNLSK